MEQKWKRPSKDGLNQVTASSCITANAVLLQVQTGQQKLMWPFVKRKGRAETSAISQHQKKMRYCCQPPPRAL
jgi:hypothetical protein